VTPLAVDSHAFTWFFEGSPTLSTKARDALAADDAFWFVPAICVCEIVLTLRKGRYRLTPADARRAFESPGRLRVVPIDYSIALESTRLTTLDGIHDQLIVATTMRLMADHPTLRLVTNDRLIRASNLVPTLW
jgi:PIN domain nuclease of toxin-antitoxin system